MSKEEKTQLIKYAYDNFLPEDKKKALELGISNFRVVTSNNSKKYQERCLGNDKDKNFCSSLISQTQTFYKYDMGIALSEILSFISSQKGIIKNIENVCPRFDEELEFAVKEFDPSKSIEKFILQNNLRAVDSSVFDLGKKLDVKFNNKRKHNPIAKQNPFSQKAIYTGYKGDCYNAEEVSLDAFDKAQLLGIKFLNKVVNYFSPKMPVNKK
ncbi:hypothetical protein M900_1787 [Bacteriovorax sp. Seq25_V]|nr:hypothetical protein M900_1787 [Bacteriovorax sp. Seq25_V]